MTTRKRKRCARNRTRHRIQKQVDQSDCNQSSGQSPEGNRRSSSKVLAEFVLTPLERAVLEGYRRHLELNAKFLGRPGCWEFYKETLPEARRYGSRVAETLEALVYTFAAKFKGESGKLGMKYGKPGSEGAHFDAQV